MTRSIPPPTLAVISFLAGALLLAACSKAPVSSTQTDNKDITADKMFTTDGCTVYRFSDNGELHYFAHCSGDQQSSVTNRVCRSTGKVVVCRDDDVAVSS